MNSKNYFFKYAFPCAHLKLERGDITQEEHESLKKKFLENNPPSKENLERVFAPGFVFIKRLAKKMGKDHWDIEVQKEYWEKEHNEIIKRKEGNYSKFPEALNNLCKISVGEIKKNKNGLLLVKYNKDKKRVVKNSLIPNAKVGDKIKIHYGYAIEKI
jgi:hypothetical protein